MSASEVFFKPAHALRIASWNVGWQSTMGWAARRHFLRSLDADVLYLQEVRGDVATRLGDELAAWASTTRPYVQRRWRKRNALVVAVSGLSTVREMEVDVLEPDDFPEAPDWLAARFAARALAVDIEWRGHGIRVGSFHATPASSKGVGEHKPKFHTRVGEWVATWPGPWAFGIDANSHTGDHRDLARVRWCWPAVGSGPGEDRLLGVLAPHAGTDALRRVFTRDGFPPDPGLARVWRASKLLAAGPARYDHLVVSPSVEVISCDYIWPPEDVSGHAAVVVDLMVAGGDDPPALQRRPWRHALPLPEPATGSDPGHEAGLRPGGPRLLAADDPAWSSHSGGSGHDRPGWTMFDVPAACRVVARLNDTARRALEILVAEPGLQVPTGELARRCHAKNAHAVAASLRTFAGLGELDRRLPLRWWKAHGGTLYAIHPDDAIVFAAALENRRVTQEG